MKKLITGFSSILIMLISACTSSQPTPAGSLLPPSDFRKKVETTENAVILDVRTPDEYKDGHLANAVNMNWNDDAFDQQIKSLDKNEPVFVYCYGGGRSSAAAKELRKQGFENVYDLKGGMSAWRDAGLPEVK